MTKAWAVDGGMELNSRTVALNKQEQGTETVAETVAVMGAVEVAGRADSLGRGADASAATQR